MNIEFVSTSYSALDFYSAPSPNLVLLVIHQRSNQPTSSKIVCKIFHKKVTQLPSLQFGDAWGAILSFWMNNSSKICAFGELVFSLFFLFFSSHKCAVQRSPTTSLPF